MLASYFLISFITLALGQYRFSGVQAGYVINFMLLNAAVLLVPVLIWFMTNVIVRTSVQLDEVSSKVAILQQRMNQLQATKRVDSSL